MGIKETSIKVLDKDTTLAKKIKMLFQEQGIPTASIVTAICLAIGILVEALLPRDETAGTAGKPLSKDEKGVKEWIRNKLKDLARLLGRSGVKVAEALSIIIGVVISWILNRAAEVVGWVSKNLWALVIVC